MKDMSNKTLVFLLLAAITVSLGGTFMSLNRLNLMAGSGITGLASGNESGTTTLTVLGFNSISMITSTLNMGSCTPAGGNGSWVNTTQDTTLCSAASEQVLNLTVQNDGNQAINVTVRSSVNASQFLGGGTGPRFQFRVENTSGRAGCRRNHYDNKTENSIFTEFAVANTLEYWGCANLTYIDSADEMVVEFQWLLPSDSPPLGARTATISFNAVSIT